jgi:uncharacterized protein (TIGR03067 family)
MIASIACACVVLCFGDGVAPAELQGGWRLVSVEANGKAEPLAGSRPRWTIKGEKVRYGGEDLATLAADAGSTPKTIDVGFLSPKRTLEGVYAIDGDTLKICLNKRTDGVKERPLVLSTVGKDDWRLLVFRRDKAAEGEGDEGLRGYVGLALSFTEGPAGGVVVDEVLADSPAKAAGLSEGDVILAIGDEAVTKLRPAIEAVRRAKPGGRLAIHIRRDGKEEDVAVKVGVLPFTFLVDLG